MSTCVVTGANRGIGLELAKQLSSRGRSVVAVCRQTSDELAKLPVRVEAGIDVGEPASWDDLARRLGSDDIELLIHNAGVLRPDSLDSTSPDEVRAWLHANLPLLAGLGLGDEVRTHITAVFGNHACRHRLEQCVVHRAVAFVGIDDHVFRVTDAHACERTLECR